MNSELDLKTTSRDSFADKSKHVSIVNLAMLSFIIKMKAGIIHVYYKYTIFILQPATVHVDRARWKRQMAGSDMMNCTRYEGFKDVYIYFIFFLSLNSVSAKN